MCKGVAPVGRSGMNMRVLRMSERKYLVTVSAAMIGPWSNLSVRVAGFRLCGCSLCQVAFLVEQSGDLGPGIYSGSRWHRPKPMSFTWGFI